MVTGTLRKGHGPSAAGLASFSLTSAIVSLPFALPGQRHFSPDGLLVRLSPIPLASPTPYEQFGVSDLMNAPNRAEMVLVYDLRRDRRYREQVLSGVEDQWEAYLRGERPASVTEGRITRLFNGPNQEAMFELKDGARGSSWPRQGDPSWYGVGLRAKVECVVFVPDLIGDMPVVTRIWIGK